MSKAGVKRVNLRLAYLSFKDRFKELPFEIFCEVYKSWEIKPIIRNDVYLGVVLLKNQEAHIAILPEFRKHWSGKWLGPLIKSCMKDGVVYTSVLSGDTFRLKLAQRLGWRILETDGITVKLIMTMEDYNNVWSK